MAQQPAPTNIITRLKELETEISEQVGQSGAATLPQDPQLTALMSHILLDQFPGSDLQIVVSSSRKTTTTKQFYETETPGMIGLETEQLRELQRKLMDKISTSPSSFDQRAQPPQQQQRSEGEENGGKVSSAAANGSGLPPANGTGPASVQHKETTEEGFANGDGTQVVSKKMTRVVTTSQSSVSGADEFGRPVEREHDPLHGRNGSAAAAAGGGGGGRPVPLHHQMQGGFGAGDGEFYNAANLPPAGHTRMIPIRRAG